MSSHPRACVSALILRDRCTDSVSSQRPRVLAETQPFTSHPMPSHPVNMQVARKSEAVVLRLREKGEAPPLANDGYWLKAGGAAAAAPAADGAAVGGAGAGGK